MYNQHTKEKLVIIIPARIQSARFYAKVLCDIFGLPMVVATAKRVENIDETVVATDSTDVVNACKKHGIKSVLTSSNHTSGTDRINEAAAKLGLKNHELIINVQADEPFIESAVVKAVFDKLKTMPKDEFKMVSCYKTIDKNFAQDPNHVKLILDKDSNAIYFSRSKLPYDRQECDEYFGHLGIYGFDFASLKEFCALKPPMIEETEKLEQLRAIYHAKKIAMIRVKSDSFGIDSKEDLKRALEKWQPKN